jgi:hypothetical protein
VHDGSKPPTQGNIVKVYELKFGNDTLSKDKERAYKEIAGDPSKFEELRPESCGCDQGKLDPIPNPISAKDAALLALLALAALALLLDGVPGDEIPVLAALGKLL